jgi:hypothetical protein
MMRGGSSLYEVRPEGHFADPSRNIGAMDGRGGSSWKAISCRDRVIQIEFSKVVGQFKRMAFNVSDGDSKSHRRPEDVEIGWPLKQSGRADPSFTAPAEKFHPAFSYFK